MTDTSQEGQNATPAKGDDAYKLGVLLVHGLGEARRGETLLWAGEPLFNWLRSWLKGSWEVTSSAITASNKLSDSGPDRVRLDKTFLSRSDPSDPQAPPYAEVLFEPEPDQAGQTRQKWVLAECWWAADFPQASFSSLWNWALALAPWLVSRTTRNIVQQTRRTIGEIAQVVSDDIERGKFNHPLRARLLAVLAALLALFRWAAEGLIVILLHPIVFLVGLLTQVLVLALVLLAFIPPIRSLILSIQEGLATNLGDGYIIASSPISLGAMTTQVHNDVQWLYECKHCDSVAVVAHSGGCAVSYYAFTEPHNQGVELLVTYGNGLSKLEAVRKRLDERGFRFAAGGVVRLLAVLSFIAALALLITSTQPPWLTISLALAAGMVFAVASNRLSSPGKELDEEMLKSPQAKEWLDFYSVADPAPNGPLPQPVAAAASGKTTRFESTLVDNLHSIVQDHGQYWYNNEQFVSRVARALYMWAQHEELAPEANNYAGVLRIASAKRRIRTFLYLASGLLSILAIPVLWLGLGPWLYAAGSWLTDPLLHTLNATDPLKPSSLLSAVIGMAVALILVVTFKNLVLFPFWREWSVAETDAMYQHKRDFSGVDKRPAILFLLMSAVIPTIAYFAAGFGLADTNRLQAVWQGVLVWLFGKEMPGSSQPLVQVLAFALQVWATITLVFSILVVLLGWRLVYMESGLLDAWTRKLEPSRGQTAKGPQP